MSEHFQGLETRAAGFSRHWKVSARGFPSLGKAADIFSKAWKTGGRRRTEKRVTEKTDHFAVGFFLSFIFLSTNCRELYCVAREIKIR
ncbi:MAG: hypothetical protein NTY53_13060 [Kiritimatiellaeota bacterium]|nr:hypothetical protein [Kiritimatiellota bacterium]